MGYRKEVFRSLSMISQLGMSVMVPVFMCVFIGVVIDKYFNTSTLLVLLILGIGAGIRNAYILAKKVLDENVSEKEAADRKKREERILWILFFYAQLAVRKLSRCDPLAREDCEDTQSFCKIIESMI